MVALVFKASTHEAEAGRPLWVPGFPCLHSEFPSQVKVTEYTFFQKENNRKKYNFHFSIAILRMREILLIIYNLYKNLLFCKQNLKSQGQ